LELGPHPKDAQDVESTASPAGETDANEAQEP